MSILEFQIICSSKPLDVSDHACCKDLKHLERVNYTIPHLFNVMISGIVKEVTSLKILNSVSKLNIHTLSDT